MAQGLRIQDPMTIAPRSVLRVYGMRRSGNHALINWIVRNAPDGAGLFLNNCKPNRDPLTTARGVSVYDQGAEQAHKTVDAKLHAAGPSPFTVVSYEDVMPPQTRKPLFAAPEICIVVHRSFLQWAASLLRKIQGNPGYGPLERTRVMMQSMRTYGDMLNRIQDDDVVPVCFDDWTSDETYRRTVLGRLGLPGTDLNLGPVQRYGGGSSFQDDLTDGTELATQERAAQMAKDLEYQLLLWTAARDFEFMQRLAEVFPQDAERLSQLLDTATAQVTLP